MKQIIFVSFKGSETICVDIICFDISYLLSFINNYIRKLQITFVKCPFWIRKHCIKIKTFWDSMQKKTICVFLFLLDLFFCV